MYALVDCNNFYCSVERLFNPKLQNMPVIVLSNNDGCVIARSEEAKQLGIVMGTPAHMIEKFRTEKNVAVFSSNYTLYGDMSDRVMKTLGSFVPRMEIYSIDEAFLDMHSLPYNNLHHLGLEIRSVLMKHIGIPVTVGIASTKTLAKMANQYAKKRRKEVGVFYASDVALMQQMLSETDVKDVCGIGHQYALLLRRHGINTALELSRAPEEWVRKNLSVVGQRILNELKGTATIEWQFENSTRKNICTSRSFGHLLRDKNIIREAVCNHAASCALKMRQEKTCCRSLRVFISTNPHKTEEMQYARSIDVDLETPSNHTADIIGHACKGFELIFKPGLRYMKCGVIVNDLIPASEIQQSLFDTKGVAKRKSLMNVLDKINTTLGKEIVRMAVQGYEKRYRLKAEWLSPRYTTNINEILKVRI